MVFASGGIREWCVHTCFFSSRRRHTRYWRDWSSDVCSSDLGLMEEGAGLLPAGHPWNPATGAPFRWAYDPDAARRLLAEAGFSPRNPLRAKIGISTSGSGQMQPMAMNEALQQMLKEVGIDIAFEVFEWNTDRKSVV